MWVEILRLPLALLTVEDVEQLGTTLGTVDHLDRLGMTYGKRAKVKVIYRIFDPIKAAFPTMTYEFTSSKAALNLSFRYEEVVGFRRVCGLLEHRLGGYEGPSDTSGVV